MSSSLSSRVFNWRVLLVLLLLLGAALRVINLTVPPLDFHPVRQLRNLIVARSIYYRLLPNPDAQKLVLAQAFYNAVGQYEPPITESITAWTYTWTGGENIAVPRLYETLFWLVAGLALFDLARRIASPTSALMALAYFLVLPFAVQASRSFQPDPLMTSAFIVGIYFLYRWSEEQNWKWAALAGVLIGLAVLVKIVIVFLVIGAAIAAVLSTLGLRFWRSAQVWAMMALMAIPAFVYYILGHPGRSDEYFFAWTVGLIQLITTTSFYAHWLGFIGSLFGLTILFLSIAGVFLAPPRLRWMLIGIWTGYFIYGLTLPFQMYTHSYYHIQLIPVVALGLVPISEALAVRVSGQPRWLNAALTAIVVVVIGYQSWIARSDLVAQAADYRREPAYWENVAKAIPANADLIGLTQDYGYRLMYYGWRKIVLWPYVNGLTEVKGTSVNAQAKFSELVAGRDYFLVTASNQLDAQPELKKILDGYAIAAQGEGFVLYDLHRPK
ncbi:MAG TPA: glycosyltransferase family 39 protein [Anaerolineales bacterium]|nr:glycosyltransferase family 39 protein [Anaerolineales bacterium]